ncbi:uncharacterized protein SCHCODRAFT_02513734 [Schizophyllum commune H4-8]|uniref:uncharacterized protein n=1 Tax=Schizophyllum commune (strain H4-8 / FGSC 9210) TaxID=578458 RepID=UPI0021604E21|nr:uncharacterized protein SCHCODRAFT_02513734 [Schizophyllum commune H4-8]KAI5888597.1 hypothetical protein SCHCODRAFT_02513734 [Schizophyllum commune H4-8]
MDNTSNRPFQLRLNTKPNPKPFASFLQHRNNNQQSSSQDSSGGQASQRRWMDPNSNAARASPAPPRIFHPPEPQNPLHFKTPSDAPASDHSVDDFADEGRIPIAHRASAETQYPEDKTQYATPPPPTMKIPSTHSRYERSATPQPAPPLKGLRARLDTNYDYEPDTREPQRARQASMLSFFSNDNLAQLAQEHAAREEAMHALHDQLEESKANTSRLTRLLKERDHELAARTSALAELKTLTLSKDEEHAKQVQELGARLDVSASRISTLEGETDVLKKQLLDAGDRLAQAAKTTEDSERRAVDAERRCEQAIRDNEARVAFLTQQMEDVRTDARAQVDETREEAQNIKDEAKKRMHDLKTAMKKRVDGLTERFTELTTTFTAVQSQRASWDSRASEVELGVQDLQATVKTGLAAMQPILTADAGVLRIAETRAVIEELQADRANANQVTDMLRDKLHVVSTQLVEAKDRVAELERMLAEDKHRVQSSVSELSRLVGVKVEDMAVELTKKARENSKNMDEAEQVAHELGTANATIDHLRGVLAEKDAELEALRPVKEEVAHLRIKCDTKTAELEQLLVLRDEKPHLVLKLEALETAAKETSHKLQTSEARVADLSFNLAASNSKLDAIEDSKKTLLLLQRERQAEMVKLQDKYEESLAETVELRTQKANLEDVLVKAQTTVHSLEDRYVDLRSARDRLEAAQDEAQQARERMEQEYIARISALDATVQQLRGTLSTAQDRLTVAEERVHAGSASIRSLEATIASQEALLGSKDEEQRSQIKELEALRGRYDNQTESLRACRLELGEIQGRLTQAEVASSVAAAKAQAEADRRGVAEAALAAANDRLARHSQASAAVDQRLTVQEQAHNATARALRERAETAEQETIQLRIETKALGDMITDLKARIAELDLRPAEVDTHANDELSAELADAKGRVAALEQTVAELNNDAETLCERYQDNRLSPKEKEFMVCVLNRSKSIHEQEMVAKGNELRRRENTINNLKKELASVQAHLARVLREQRQDDGPRSSANKSIFNINAWISSSPQEQPPQEGPSVASPVPTPNAKRSAVSPPIGESKTVATTTATPRAKTTLPVDEAKPARTNGASSSRTLANSTLRTPVGHSLRRPLTPKPAVAPRKPFGKIDVDTEEDYLSPIEDEDEDEDDGDDYMPLASARADVTSKKKGKGKAAVGAKAKAEAVEGKVLLGKRSHSSRSVSPVKPVTRRQRTTTATKADSTAAAMKAATKSENKPTRQRKRG